MSAATSTATPTTAPATPPAATPAPDRWERMDPHKMAMLAFIASETVFFTMLILTYIFYRETPANAGGPTAANALDIPLTGLFTVALLARSGTIWMADRSLTAGKEGAMRLWLLATIVLGAVFLGGQANEYARLLTKDVTVTRDLFGTTFYTLTGFHAFHVFGGLVALLILFLVAMTGQFKGSRHSSALETISLYWHFVDVVWIFVFSVVYLWALAG
jgi:heme/copper-type cytochrome/quinol oxidase subunit 3